MSQPNEFIKTIYLDEALVEGASQIQEEVYGHKLSPTVPSLIVSEQTRVLRAATKAGVKRVQKINASYE